MADALDGGHTAARCAPGLEEQAIATGRKTVGVAEDDGAGRGGGEVRQTMRSEGLVILRMGS